MSDLPKRKLGRTGIDVTILGFGAMELRGSPRGPEISEQEAERVLNGVLDAGINFIDTSIDYGRSEERIGRFISHRRGEYFLASKCGVARGAPSDWQRTNYMVPGTTMRERWEHAELDELLEGIDRIEFTLRFTLSHPGLSTTIVGTKNLEHLRANVEAAKKGPLPSALLARAKQRLDEVEKSSALGAAREQAGASA